MLEPLSPPYHPDVAETLTRLMGRRTDVEPLRLFRTIAHHPELLDGFRKLGAPMLSFGRRLGRGVCNAAELEPEEWASV